MADAPRAVEIALRLPAHPACVSVARQAVRSLHHWASDDSIERAEIAISELVSNAIRHGSKTERDTVVVEVTASDAAIEACVSDAGPAFSASGSQPQPDEAGGFGLYIVEQLADTWGIERTPAGNQVRFRVCDGYGNSQASVASPSST